MKLLQLEEHKCFDGVQYVYEHESKSTHSSMRFAIFLPPVFNNKKIPVVYWLSGLECTEQNFITKAGAQRMAAALGLALVVPDTSPRHVNVPIDKQGLLGEGAGFYIDATEPPWEAHYQMAHYVTYELPALVQQHFNIDPDLQALAGHSMGGHGALSIAIKNPDIFRSLSVLAPLCSPLANPWGRHVFLNYLGSDTSRWEDYDACSLIRKKPWPHGPILLDQGLNDDRLAGDVGLNLFKKACQEVDVTVNVRLQEGYDHGYYFVSSFIDDHLRFHANNLRRVS